jgi:AcrR family transcriptional regulator
VNGTRLARNLSAGAVAGIAAVASYEHMRVLAAHYGQPDLISNLMPVSVDGLIIVSTIAMADDKRSARAVRWSARTAFVVGVCASVAANVLATPGGLVARLISAWPAVALLMVVEVLSRRGKSPLTEATSAPVAEPVVTAAGDPGADTSPDAPADITPDTARTLKRTPRRTPKTDTATAARRLRARHPDMPTVDIARRLGVSDRTVRRHLNSTPTRTPTVADALPAAA